MSSDIYVTFGGDTSAAEAALAVFQAQIRSANRELAANARAMNDAGAAANSAFGQKVKASVATLDAARAGAAAMKAELATVGKAAEEGFGGLEISSPARAPVPSTASSSSSPARPNAPAAPSWASPFTWRRSTSASPASPPWRWRSAPPSATSPIRPTPPTRRCARCRTPRRQTVSPWPPSRARRSSLQSQTLGDVSQSAAVDMGKAFAPLGPEVGAIVARMAAVDIKALAGSEKELGATAEMVAKRFIDLDSEGKKYVETSRAATQEDKERFAAFVASGDKANAYLMIVRLIKFPQ